MTHIRKGSEARKRRRERALARRRIECQYLIAGIFPDALCPYEHGYKVTETQLQAKIDAAQYDIERLT